MVSFHQHPEMDTMNSSSKSVNAHSLLYEMVEMKMEPEDSFRPDNDTKMPLVIAAHDAHSDEEIEIQTDEQAPCPSGVQTKKNSVQHAPVVLKSKSKAKAKAEGNQLRGCTSFKKDDRPVIHRCTGKISVEEYRRRRARMAMRVDQPRVSKIVPEKKVRFGSDVFVVLPSDDEMEDKDKEKDGESTVDVQEPLLQPSKPSSSSMPMNLNPVIKAEGQPTSIIAGSSMENRDKKMWFCSVCTKEYPDKNKNQHLKTQLHAKNSLSAGVPQVYGIELVMWHCVVCNEDYGRKHENAHMKTQKHQKNLEENIQNNNSNDIKLF